VVAKTARTYRIAARSALDESGVFAKFEQIVLVSAERQLGLTSDNYTHSHKC